MLRKFVTFLIIFFVLIFVIIVPNVIANPYPVDNYDATGEWSNCTWSAWEIVHDTLGIELPDWGFSGDWKDNAEKSGYPTGDIPKKNSIIVYKSHVAFVDQVSSDGTQIYVKEGGYRESPDEKERYYHEGWKKVYGSNVVGYIYLEESSNINDDNPPKEDDFIADINNDSKVDTNDAILILRYTIGLQKLTDTQKNISDVNKDGKIDTNDAIKVLRYTIGLV